MQRSTFAAVTAAPAGFQLFFSGLPQDVTENMLLDLLDADSIPRATSSVVCFHGNDRETLGMAMVSVSNEVDAEKLRSKYCGMVIDGTFKLSVQHLLPPTQALPSYKVAPFIVPPPAPAAPVAHARKTEPSKNQHANGNQRPEGLKLLSRLSRPGQGKVPDKRDQMALLNKQRANMKGKSPGDDLMARLNRPKVPTTGAAAKAKNARQVSGASKVGRAKANSAKDKMDVDEPLGGRGAAGAAAPAGSRSGKKTAAQLDEEMRLYDRGRRFA